MRLLTSLIRSSTFFRINPSIIVSSRRCLASTSETTEASPAKESPPPEIGPSAPELQLNNLNGDLQSNY